VKDVEEKYLRTGMNTIGWSGLQGHNMNSVHLLIATALSRIRVDAVLWTPRYWEHALLRGTLQRSDQGIHDWLAWEQLLFAGRYCFNPAWRRVSLQARCGRLPQCPTCIVNAAAPSAPTAHRDIGVHLRRRRGDAG